MFKRIARRFVGGSKCPECGNPERTEGDCPCWCDPSGEQEAAWKVHSGCDPRVEELTCGCDFGIYCPEHPESFLGEPGHNEPQDDDRDDLAAEAEYLAAERLAKKYEPVERPVTGDEYGAFSEPLNVHDPLNSMCDCADCLLKGHRNRPLSAYRQHLTEDTRVKVIGSTHQVEVGNLILDLDGSELQITAVYARGLVIATPTRMGHGSVYLRRSYLAAVIGRARWLQAASHPKYAPDFDYDPDNRLGA